jgi:hypothetical protein
MAAVQQHLRSTAEWQLDLDEAGEAVDLGEPAEHAPYIRVVGLDSKGVSLWATVYYPIDVDERSWDATELDEQLNADDAVRLFRAVEQTIASEAG